MNVKYTTTIGRPPRISREDIASAALNIGLNNITLKKIASHLGVDHSSLYRHVKNRKDITYDALELAVTKINLSNSTTDWKEYLHYIANEIWELYSRYKGLAATMRTSERTPPTAIAMFSVACNKLETLGFKTEDAALIIDSIIDMTTDSASTWQQLNTLDDEGHKAAERLSHSWEIAKNSNTIKHVGLIIKVIENDPKQWWLKKLSLLISGAEKYNQSQY